MISRPFRTEKFIVPGVGVMFACALMGMLVSQQLTADPVQEKKRKSRTAPETQEQLPESPSKMTVGQARKALMTCLQKMHRYNSVGRARSQDPLRDIKTSQDGFQFFDAGIEGAQLYAETRSFAFKDIGSATVKRGCWAERKYYNVKFYGSGVTVKPWSPPVESDPALAFTHQKKERSYAQTRKDFEPCFRHLLLFLAVGTTGSLCCGEGSEEQRNSAG